MSLSSDPQYYFDLAWRHAVVNRQPPSILWEAPNLLYPAPAPACRYRTPEGNRCFIGLAIPDDLYKSDYEGFRVNNLPLSLWSDNPSLLEFLFELQRIHDHYACTYAANHNLDEYVTLVRQALVLLAHKYKLSIPAKDLDSIEESTEELVCV